ncbi:MAG: Mrp/NBP35 family ATP-binding protein [Pseudomonadota bacterium]
MPSINNDKILSVLSQVIDRETGRDVVSSGMISGVAIKGGKVGFLVTIDPKEKEIKSYLREACEKAVYTLDGVESVTAVLTAQNAEPIAPKPEAGYSQPRERAQWNLTPVENVKNVIAIASGKGGVGKSTTAVNLALAFSALGKNVGLLDADIYGPSIPRMLSLSGQPEIVDGKMIPHERYGIKTNSMGYITGEEAAILRGPMISKTLHQLLRMTRWGTVEKPMDVLLVDMPPGTGDIHLSMVQQVPLTGALIVTTPQEVATIDAKKCGQMFLKTGVKLLGVIENMSYFTDSNGNKICIFGEGGGARLASELSTLLLGSVAIDPLLREVSDSGMRYEGIYADSYKQIATNLLQTLATK